MPQDFQPEPKNESPQTSSPALVLLVLITLVVAGSVFWVGQSQSPAPAGNVTNQQADQSDTVTYQSTEPVETTDDIPSGLFVGSFDLVQNRALQTGSNQQRVVIYDTNTQPDQLALRFQRWLENTGYNIMNASQKENGGSYMADRAERRLTIVYSQQADKNATRVQINYID